MTLASDRASEAMGRHDWEEAYQVLAAADREGDLSADDLQVLAQAAWWSGRADSSTEAWERAYAAHHQEGNQTAAALAAVRLAEMSFRRMSFAVGSGWLARAERLVESEPESAAHAWLAFVHSADSLFRLGDWDATIAFADQAIEIGRRQGSRDVESIALSFKGQALVRKGRWADGLALFDEATATAVAGELDPKTACDVFCSTIAGCRSLADYRRAGEWTEMADKWMARQSIRGYRGACRFHRAELLRVRGDWERAEEEVLNACEELEQYRLLDVLGDAYYELGELRLRMGDLEGAEQALNRAFEEGRDPQPGLALLYLARGDPEVAADLIGRSLSPPEAEVAALDPLVEAGLLPAAVEIALARSDLDAAEGAVRRLEELAGIFGSDALVAAWLTARGSVELERGAPEMAVATLEKARRRWHDADVPYEAARARLVLGQAKAAGGDMVGGRLELQAARAVFERLGATPDIRRVHALLEPTAGSERPRRRERLTFVFTDIVGSTDMVGVIGDEAWERLLAWHDRTLRSAFARHRGEEVRHTGDGFFVAFRGATDAVDCAMEIHRHLAGHREEHGFAPSVRIGMHTAEATRTAEDFAGQGVHLAARVAALAAADEILVTRAVADALGDHGHLRTGEPRPVRLKGIDGEVEVLTVAWR